MKTYQQFIEWIKESHSTMTDRHERIFALSVDGEVVARDHSHKALENTRKEMQRKHPNGKFSIWGPIKKTDRIQFRIGDKV